LFQEKQSTRRVPWQNDLSQDQPANGPNKLKDDIMEGFIFDQRSMDGSEGNEPMKSFMELELPNEEALKLKLTGKGINSKKRINNLNVQTEV
jgi:hypothetical protein